MVWGVAALLTALSDALQARFPVVTVQGELSGFTRAASGHCYFSLKDADGQPAMLRCAMFRRAASMVDFAPRDGMTVELRGRLDLYGPRGELQFIVEAMRRSGEGALYEQFLRLKARLEAQGWFDPDRKRRPPPYARRIGVITSTGGAALHDVLTALRRRAPHARVFIYPTLVQGSEAPPAIVRALAAANARADAEVLLLVRGGGSLEDLWAFNDERVVQAVGESALPVICGVGHETDITLADLAADLRAPTPTAAAELATVARQQCVDSLDALERQLRRRVEQRLRTEVERVVVREGHAPHPQQRQRIDGRGGSAEVEHAAGPRLPTFGEAALEVEQHAVGRCQDLEQLLAEERPCRMGGEVLGDTAAEHRVAGERQRRGRHRSSSRSVGRARWPGTFMSGRADRRAVRCGGAATRRRRGARRSTARGSGARARRSARCCR